jgi:hypothetical protein
MPKLVLDMSATFAGAMSLGFDRDSMSALTRRATGDRPTINRMIRERGSAQMQARERANIIHDRARAP